MPLVSVEILGPLRSLIGGPLVGLLRRSHSLRAMLSILATELKAHPDYGQPDTAEELQAYLLLLVNGIMVDASMFDAELKESDRVTLLTLSHGG